MPKGTKYEEIQGVGASSIDSIVLHEAGQGTFYGGLKVTENIKNQLMEQEIGSYLHAVKTKDGDYLLKPKLPEKGQVETGDETKVYSIRKNYNRIMKGIAGQFFDEKGNMDLKQAYEFVHKLKYEVEMAASDELTSPQLKKLIGYDKLDETERTDFDTFMNVEGSRFNVVNMLETGLKAELSKAYHYQRICNKDKKNLTSDEKKLLRDSERDYVQLLNRYVKMKNMDVENEYEFYLSADCGTSASIHQTHYKNVMHYRNPDAELADVSSIFMEDAEGTFDNTEQEQNHTAACVNLNFMEQKKGVDANFNSHYKK